MVEKVYTAKYGEGTIEVFRLTNGSGAWAEVSNMGAGIIAVSVPDRTGVFSDVALGFKAYSDFMVDTACYGKTPGRYANRIARGELTIDGEHYQLAINNGPNHLHGGPTNYSRRLWQAEADAEGVTFTMISPDGDENYPGNLKAEVRYRFSEQNELQIDYRATTDAPTVINLTNHAYWNLKGVGGGTALDHELKLFAERWLPTDPSLVPTGELQPVADTPMDFRTAKSLGRDIEADFAALKYGKGYDNCWMVDGWQSGKLCPVAELYEASSGRLMRVESDQPGVQVYTGNWLGKGELTNKAGERYNDYDGVAIECQELPDAPNKPNFPSTLLRPGEEYRRTIRFCFSVR